MNDADSREGRRRWLVLTMGRSGSSLLCASMADAGADVGQPPPADWDPRLGEMENTAMRGAARHLRRARDISAGGQHLLSPALESAWRFRRGRRALAGALAQAACFKSADLDLVAQPTLALGYEPRIILSYRQPGPSLRSLIVGRKRTTPDQLIADYLRVYRQGLALMLTFGGCAVSFDELQDPGATQWSDALAAVTGLDAGQLLAARDARLNAPVPEPAGAGHYPEADALYEAVAAWQGMAVPPARSLARKLDARDG